MSTALVELQGVTKIYRLGEVEVPALREVDLRVEPGDFLALMGPSGSGKSTLLHILGLLDRPSAGKVLWEGEDVTRLNGGRLAELRGRRIGFVFQMFNLVPNLTALENVELPLVFLGVSLRERRKRAEEALVRLGLGERLHHRPSQLSGGQQQRVALARALITDPALLIADEPTGNLDTTTGREILTIFSALNKQGRTIVLATHDPEAAEVAKARIRLRDGRIMGGTP
ncbi:MAG: ABC transporter ATP-binding protein [Candidatus Bipolaricaulota bacterium]|nr:ABC transporter ATP-binding protein [Candidatus Bipolaricaulota bacterium]MDW8126432.1 ABC transporter ATP-binding protein [Candidatus Bipolaricaulota bacterium]